MLNVSALDQLKQLKSDIKASRNLELGTVKGTDKKFGFVTLDSGRDVFLPPDEMLKVLPGDRVEVEIIKQPKSKTAAKLERLISSDLKEFFGKYITRGQAHFVEADVFGVTQWFFIPPNKRKQTNAKDLVKCKVTQHPFKSGKAQAAVLDVIGSESATGIEWQYAMAKHSINLELSEAAQQQLETLNEDKVQAVVSDREDLSSLSFVTIDSAGTQDIDDALHVEKKDDGWLLRVAIADPVSIIEPKTALESEVLTRGATTYFPGQNVPLLSQKISSDLCSLKEGVKRPAKLLEIDIDANGVVKDFALKNAAIQSHAKLSYQAVSAMLATGASSEIDESLFGLIKELDAVSSVLGWRRKEEALVQPGRTEFFIELNEQQKIQGFKVKQSTPAHNIVEECMVAANRCVAKFMQEHTKSSLFINNAGIREDRKESFTNCLKETLDKDVGDLSDLEVYRTQVRELLDSDDESGLYALLIRQIERSRIENKSSGHFGMGLESYTTFTSPLRKANDFLVHRQIDQVLSDEKVESISEAVAEKIESRVQAIRSAVNDVEQWLKCQFLATSKNWFEAEVIRVYASGCQVRLKENGIEGFISTREIEGKFSYDQDRMTLKGKSIEFALEKTIRVKKKHIDWSRKQIIFEPELNKQDEN